MSGAGCVPPALGVVSCAASGAATQSVASARHRRTTIMVGGMVGDRVDEGRARPQGAHHGRARFVTNLPPHGHGGNAELLRSCNGPERSAAGRGRSARGRRDTTVTRAALSRDACARASIRRCRPLRFQPSCRRRRPGRSRPSPRLTAGRSGCSPPACRSRAPSSPIASIARRSSPSRSASPSCCC